MDPRDSAMAVGAERAPGRPADRGRVRLGSKHGAARAMCCASAARVRAQPRARSGLGRSRPEPSLAGEDLNAWATVVDAPLEPHPIALDGGALVRGARPGRASARRGRAAAGRRPARQRAVDRASRYPALPALRPRLVPRRRIILDDARPSRANGGWSTAGRPRRGRGSSAWTRRASRSVYFPLRKGETRSVERFEQEDERNTTLARDRAGGTAWVRPVRRGLR